MAVSKDCYRGCLIGLALGDVLGVPFEFWKKEALAEYFKTHELEAKDFSYGYRSFPAGFYSDDTSMTICLAESLIEKGFDLDDQFERYKKWFLNGYATPFDDRCYGIGQQTFKALSRKRDFNEMDGLEECAGGNGSLMRCAPIALFYHNNHQEIKDKSLLSSYITHNYHISGWACVILNTIISLIINGHNKEEVIAEAERIYKGIAPKEIIDLLAIDYSLVDGSKLNLSGYSVDTLRIALWSWLTSKDYMETIKKVILLGNDTDTYGAVAGAIAGCYWGYESIPDDFKLSIKKHDYIISLTERLFNKF